MPHITSAADRDYRYATAAMDVYNSADIRISGNTLRIVRRTYRSSRRSDEITVRLGETALMERTGEWSALANGWYGYEAMLDVSTLPAGNYTLEVRSSDTFIYTVADPSFVKEAGGCYFPRGNSASKQLNFAALQLLDGGSAPNDFAALEALYGTAADSATLAEIRAKAEALTRGLGSEREKALAINKWITENIAYDMDISGDAYHQWIVAHPEDKVRLDNPLNAYREGYALCYGFARLTTLMMGYAGVDCVYITGRLASDLDGDINAEYDSSLQDIMNHAWNAVKIGGAWYFLDTSSDAQYNYLRRSAGLPGTGYTVINRDPVFRYTFPSLNRISKTHIALRLGVRNLGTKLKAASIPNGWQRSGSAASYYEDGAKVRDAWRNIDGAAYYFTVSGYMAKGWQLCQGYWRYFDDNGTLLTGTQTIRDGGEERSYTFDREGRLSPNAGWVTFAGADRYYRGIEMLTGWQFVDNHWRYFSDTGALYKNAETPLELVDGKFSFTEDGALTVEGGGWAEFGGDRHYLDGDAVRTGIRRIGNMDYFLDATGAVRSGWQSADGKTWYFGENGGMLTGWQFLDGSWYYIDRSKGRYSGVQSVGGGRHYFDAQGRLATGGWVNIGGFYLYFAEGTAKNGVQMNGKMLTGWRKADGQLRYFDRANGVMYTGTQPMLNENNNKWYTFGEDGVATLKP